MSNNRIGLALAGVLSALALLVGCAEQIEGTAVPAAYAVETFDDPTELIVHAMEVMFEWRPGSDASTADAFARANPYLSADLAAQTRSGPDEGGAQWQKWADAKANAQVEAVIASDEHPPDTADSVQRVVLIAVTIVTPDGRPLDTYDFTAWVSAGKTPQGWRVDEIEV